MRKWQIVADLADSRARHGAGLVASAIRERAGYEPAVGGRVEEGFRHILLGIDPGLPRDGYSIRVPEADGETQDVRIEGTDENALMYGCVDFVRAYLPEAALAHRSGGPYYLRPLFGGQPLPAWERKSAPRVRRRGLWTWGHVLYDYRGYFEQMVRLKLNEIIIWNDFAPVNAREVVAYAHSLGIRVIWGYAWGWDTRMRADTSESAALAIVEQYDREYADSGADGIYFQSFTETGEEYLEGRLIAEMVVEFVNRVAGMVLDRHPGLLLQFGLHATSVKNRLEYIRGTDPRVEIIWEDCGDFPYAYMPEQVSRPEETRDFTRKMLDLRPGCGVGAVLKGMICLDWGRFEHQAGPLILGRASGETIENRLAQVRPIWRTISAEWLLRGDICRQRVAQLAEGGAALYGLVEDGVLEREIPLPVAAFASILWDPARPYGEILREETLSGDVTLT